MKGGGQTLWNALAICGVSKTSWQMGKRHTRDDLENHSKGLVIPFGAMVEYRHRKIRREFFNLARKYYQESFWAMS